MLIQEHLDVPPAATAVVMLAQNDTSRTGGTANRPHVLGVCTMAHLGWSGQADLYPVVTANTYFDLHGKTVEKIDFSTAKISVLQQPKHGQVAPSSDGDWRAVRYVPSEGYLGKDYIVLQVEGNGYKVQIRYYVAVTDDMGDTKNTDPVCKETNGGHWWKISLPTLPTSTSDIQSLLTFTGISNSVSVDIADRPGTAVAQTTGQSITFDNTAAGNGWFIDATPDDNAEYLQPQPMDRQGRQ